MPRKTEPKLKLDMTVRLPREDYFTFVDFVVESGLVYPNGEPRSAEAVRVLLTSVALEEHDPSVRIAAAIYRNSHILLYAMLAQIPHRLQNQLKDVVLRSVRLRHEDRSAFEEGVVVSPRGTRQGHPGDVARLHVSLDRWLHGWLRNRFQSTNQMHSISPAIRELILSSMTDDHAEVLTGYAGLVDGLRHGIRAAIDAEVQRLAHRIMELGGSPRS